MKIKEMYTISETADALRVGIRAVYNYRLQGRIKAVKVGKSWLVPVKEIESILTNGLPEKTNEEYKQFYRDYFGKRRTKKGTQK